MINEGGGKFVPETGAHRDAGAGGGAPAPASAEDGEGWSACALERASACARDCARARLCVRACACAAHRSGPGLPGAPSPPSARRHLRRAGPLVSGTAAARRRHGGSGGGRGAFDCPSLRGRAAAAGKRRWLQAKTLVATADGGRGAGKEVGGGGASWRGRAPRELSAAGAAGAHTVQGRGLGNRPAARRPGPPFYAAAPLRRGRWAAPLRRGTRVAAPHHGAAAGSRPGRACVGPRCPALRLARGELRSGRWAPRGGRGTLTARQTGRARALRGEGDAGSGRRTGSRTGRELSRKKTLLRVG